MRRLSRREVLGGGSVAVLALLTAACGGLPQTSSGTDPAATPVVPGASTAIPEPTPNVSATATARLELQTLRMPTTEPPTLDPALATDHASVEVSVQLFEGLTEIDEANQPAPLGAEKWEITDDGRTYVFHLRKGIRFTPDRAFKGAPR